jgi:hypothetical protein
MADCQSADPTFVAAIPSALVKVYQWAVSFQKPFKTSGLASVEISVDSTKKKVGQNGLSQFC